MAISPDAEFPIVNAEKGLAHYQISVPRQAEAAAPSRLLKVLSIEGGDRVNVVPDTAVCVLDCPVDPVVKLIGLFEQRCPAVISWEDAGEGRMRIQMSGRSAHGSKPEDGINAVAWLIVFLSTLPLADDALSRTVKAVARKIGTKTDGSGLDISRSDQSGPLTLNLGYIHTLDSEVLFGLDIRYPVSEPQSFITEHVEQAFPGFSVNVTASHAAHYVAPDSDLVKGLSVAYEDVMHEKAYCLSMGGATYARAFPNSVAFGPLFPGQPATEHQPNEYIEVDSLIKIADLLAAAIVELCGQDH